MKLILICLCLMCSSIALGQQKMDEPPNCHGRDAVLYGIAKSTSPNNLITVVANLGEGEDRPNLNQRRLHNVRVYWTKFLNEYRRSPDTIILTEGEKVKGYGRLEFYVDGELKASLKLKRNSDLLVVDCSRSPGDPACPPYERNFYPCRDRYSKRRKHR